MIGLLRPVGFPPGNADRAGLSLRGSARSRRIVFQLWIQAPQPVCVHGKFTHLTRFKHGTQCVSPLGPPYQTVTDCGASVIAQETGGPRIKVLAGLVFFLEASPWLIDGHLLCVCVPESVQIFSSCWNRLDKGPPAASF